MIEGLHEVGAIDEQALRQFDDACLAPAASANADDRPNVTRN